GFLGARTECPIEHGQPVLREVGREGGPKALPECCVTRSFMGKGVVEVERSAHPDTVRKGEGVASLEDEELEELVVGGEGDDQLPPQPVQVSCFFCHTARATCEAARCPAGQGV